MYFSFSDKSSLLLIFFFHGVVFSFLLFKKGFETENKSDYWLGTFSLLSVMYVAPFMLGYAGWYGRLPYREILFYVPFQQLLLLPPVLYFYFQRLFDKSFVFRTKDLLHFLPAFLYNCYILLICLADKWVLDEVYFYANGQDKDFDAWYQFLGFLSMVYYLLRSLMLYRKYTFLTFNALSFADTMTFIWAKRFLWVFIALVGIRLVFFVINPEWDEFGRKFWYYLTFSFLFYYITISGYLNSVRTKTSFSDWQVTDTNKSSEAQMDLADSKSQHEPLPDLDEWKARVVVLMVEGKMYENPELTISDLAEKLGTHSKRISQAINQGFGLNFNDFVNKYRVEALIKKLERGEYSMVTFLGLALECGFNSKSTFNRAFKRETGQSPKEFIRNRFQN
ncbi:helix-turn-helix domain-containing protein [Lacihabitans soyangensis]|uniref:AraC family transcriptional regulator n=1 Tax=Lacihabitans soyangensis TaxID=869394 RepID=A0AAE3KX74_9BACT|nr:AraC family transcriptional regulator [Lacihabitans soyangensis]MCP9764260.1 AraC family transcriptional regulator [Lacihabitans soyangensis]